jgi:hypothetical protein
MKREISSLSILGKVTMIKSKDTKPKVAMSHQKRHQNSKRIATLLRVNLAQNRWKKKGIQEEKERKKLSRVIS